MEKEAFHIDAADAASAQRSAETLSSEHPSSQTSRQNSQINPPWLALATLAVLWLLLINQLRVEWSVNAQYAYGWTVPFLSLYLFAERWKYRPAPNVAPSGKLANIFLVALVCLLAFVLLPLRLIEEANPDWRLLGWMMAGTVVGLSLCALFRAGGFSWLRHFAFPVCFLLVAVPWPVPIEQQLIQSLMRNVASCCVEMLGWCGVPALQHGNVIEIAGQGSVGVEEACSGVRSFQTTLMISLFLGELFRFGILRRAALLGAGLLVAYVWNVGRAFFLVWISAKENLQAMEKWHDTAGFVVLAATLVLLWLVAAALRRFGNFQKNKNAPIAPEASIEADSRATQTTAPTIRARKLPRPALVAMLVWLVFIELGTNLWYRAHESSANAIQSWTIDWPTTRPQFRELTIPATSRSILRYNEGRSAAWQNDDGTHWSIVFLRWLPGRSAAQLARSHGPEICLPAAGSTLQKDLGVKFITINGITLPVHEYIFSNRGRTMNVFYALYEENAGSEGPASTRQELTVPTRMRAVFAGKRNRGQIVLEVAITGSQSPGAAESEFIRAMQKMMRA